MLSGKQQSSPLDPKALSELLSGQTGLWEHWGFNAWSDGALSGVTRQQRFVKDGFLGPIAEYYAWDYLIWDCGSEKERSNLWLTRKPIQEVMTQRFLFILPDPWPERRIKSFCFGFRGYLEFYAYWPWQPMPNAEIPPDLSGLVDLALKPIHPASD